ncbi:MAG: class I SAM-dependent methyltransferase [Sphingobacteriales bacterium]|nr:MAG: class I SAM-dependent methyltransferase [Sphingobacteriales bacterium]
MIEEFSGYYFLIVENKRLDFEFSDIKIKSFISRRLKYFGATNYEFVHDWDGAIKEVERCVADKDPALKYLVILDIMCPMVDLEVIVSMGESLARTGKAKAVSLGMIPGTETKCVLALENIYVDLLNQEFSYAKLSVVKVQSTAQNRHNNQVNLYKYKRLKLFLILMERLPNMHSLPIDGFMACLAEDRFYHLMLSFGEDLRLETHEECPYCSGKIHPLFNTISQPICGFVSAQRAHYSECEGCGLVVASPYIHENDISKVYDKWDKQDFVVSSNNAFNKESIRCDFKKIESQLPHNTASLDLGGGVGNFSRYLVEQYPQWDVTHSDFAIKADIGLDIQCRTLDFTNEDIGNESYDLITAWEVIEHVPVKKLKYVYTIEYPVVL